MRRSASSGSTGEITGRAGRCRGRHPAVEHRWMPAKTPSVDVEVDGHTVNVSNPDKVFFSARGETKLDLVRYYVAVGPGALRGVCERPTVLKRFPHGAEGDFFYQKRVPAGRPPWIETVTVHFPSGRSAEELCPVDVAHIAWAANLGCLDLNPWPVRRADVDHPDELRVDLDPQPGVRLRRRAAGGARGPGRARRARPGGLPEDVGVAGHARQRAHRTAGWDFTEVRRAALALARARRAAAARGGHLGLVEGAAGRAGVHRLQPERPGPDGGVGLLGAGQPRGPGVVPARMGRGARRRAVRPDPRHRPGRFADPGRPGARRSTSARFDLGPLLELAARDEADGLGDAPGPRISPSRRESPHRAAPSRCAAPTDLTRAAAGRRAPVMAPAD